MEINGPVCVVTRRNERKMKGRIYSRKVIIGITSTLEKAWKLIQRDYRYCISGMKQEIRFTDTSPWGGVYDGLETKDYKTSYHIETHRIDLFAD